MVYSKRGRKRAGFHDADTWGSKGIKPLLVEADLGHEMGEARVGTQRVGHGVDVQVDEAVDAFLEIGRASCRERV